MYDSCQNALPEKCWKQIWPLQEKLSIPNILQLIEICILLPLSNAEVERILQANNSREV